MVASKKPKHILVADDDLAFRILVEQALLDLGFDVECVGDGDEAHRRVSEQRPDLVLLDNVMPGRPGSEVCKSLCEELGAECPPIVMVTGCDGESDIADAFAAGAHDYLVKPVNWALFKHRVQGWLGGDEEALVEGFAPSGQGVEMTVSGRGEIIELKSSGLLPDDIHLVSIDDFLPKAEVARLRPLLRRVLRARESQQEEIEAEIGGRAARWTVQLDPRGRDKVNIEIYESVSDRGSRGQLFRLAYVDSATGLPNRHLFLQTLKDRLGRAKFQQQGLEVICLTLGSLRDRQDESLRFVERLVRIGQAINEAWADDDRLQRFEIPGGDKFCLASLDARHLVAIVNSESDRQTHHDFLETAKSLASGEEGLGCGVARYPQDGDIADVLVDSAIHNACAMLEPEVRPEDVRQAVSLEHDDDLEIEVLQALRSEQLEVHYQPRVDLETGSVIAGEALVRWIHPLFGLVSGAQIFDRLASSVATRELTDWAMREACRQVAKWIEVGLSVRVTVNVADEQLMRGSFDDTLLTLVNDLAIPAECIELEVSESACDLTPFIRRQLADLHAAGIGLVIDDFGTGKLRLDTLSELSPDAFKVDWRNQRDGAGGDKLLAMAQAIATSCGGTLIAKHVETASDLKNAHSAGCEQAQGFQICQPLAATDFIEYVSALALSDTSSLELAATI